MKDDLYLAFHRYFRNLDPDRKKINLRDEDKNVLVTVLKIYGFFPLLLFISNTVYPANRYWVGTSSGNWNNTANWSNVSGGSAGYSVPGANDLAIFDRGSTSCSVNMNVTVKGLIIGSLYTGTVSLNPGVTITVTTDGFSQTGGTFICNDGDIAIQGAFDVTGGLFLTNGILDIGGEAAPSTPTASPDLTMDFEDSQEPYEEVAPRTLDPEGNGNGCVESPPWNNYYIQNVCVATNCPLTDFAIERSTAQKRSGNTSARFYLKPTSLDNWPSGEATHRAELGPHWNSPVPYPVEGDEIWYGISYYFPSDFIFAPNNIENDIRFIIAQWQHGSPGSPAVALEVMGDEIVMQRQEGNSTNGTWINPVPFTTIQRGQWMDFVLRIKWSKTNGLVECWVNGQKKYTATNVQTMYSNLSVGGGFKMGIYYWRWKEYQSVQNSLNAGITYRQIFIDEVRQYKGTNGFEVVAPRN
jgi:hypothetical protein